MKEQSGSPEKAHGVTVRVPKGRNGRRLARAPAIKVFSSGASLTDVYAGWP